MVQRLQCFRGISVHSAMVLATEIVDWRRFEPRERNWRAISGSCSREDSSGDRHRLGSITKAGNSHCRHVLVQAAWSYRHRPSLSVDLKRRQQGQPPAVIAHAWKAQQRLHQRYQSPLVSQAATDRRGRRRARAGRLPVGGRARAGVAHGSSMTERMWSPRRDVRARSTALCGQSPLTWLLDPRV